ncbi:MAG: nuclear transport factor 2 family protein [Pseudomonadota bacterium]
MNNNEQSVREIKQLLKAWGDALYCKDLQAMHKDYADAYCLYDVKESVNDVEGVKQLWRQCFPYFDKPTVEYKDMVIHASDDMAVAYFRCRISGTAEPMPEEIANAWLRGTAAYRKIDGQWKCIHEHNSFPVNAETMTADLTA